MWLKRANAHLKEHIVFMRVAEAESDVFGWNRIPNNTGSRSLIFLSSFFVRSGCPVGSFFKSHS